MTFATQVIQIGKRPAVLNMFTGRVVHAGKNMETRVHGSGGGGFVTQGTGFAVPVSISSTTIVHDELFIQNADGEERSLHLKGFNLEVREDNNVTAIWAMPGGTDQGPCIAIVNHSTNKQFIKDGSIREVVIDCTLPFIDTALNR